MRLRGRPDVKLMHANTPSNGWRLHAAPPANQPSTGPSQPTADTREQVAALQAELDHVRRLATLGTIAAAIAHEINNLLTPVLSYAQLASAHPEDRAIQSKATERTIAGVEATASIVRSILGFAAAADVTSRADNANICLTLKGALDCMARDPAKDGVRIVNRVPPAAEVRVSMLALQQVLLNLMLNACRAMKPRGGQLTISAEERPNGTISITLADTGPGLPQSILARLFQPFATTGHAAPGSDATGQGGTGLGLMVCRELINRAGGSIAAANSPTGATFTIILPASRRNHAQAG